MTYWLQSVLFHVTLAHCTTINHEDLKTLPKHNAPTFVLAHFLINSTCSSDLVGNVNIIHLFVAQAIDSQSKKRAVLRFYLLLSRVDFLFFAH